MAGERPVNDPDERVFALSDVKKLFLRQKKKIIKSSVLGALLVFLYFLTSVSATYQIRATFKESDSKGGGGGAEEMQKLLISFSGGGVAEFQTPALILSYPVLKPLVQRLGLQAVVPKKGKFSKFYKTVRDNLLAERRRPLSDVDWFVFRDVTYEGEEGTSYSLRFEDTRRFAVLLGNKLLAQGEIGSPVRLPDACFTLVKAPQRLRIMSQYPLSIQPWTDAVQNFRSQIRITLSPSQKAIYELNFFERDRHFGREALNALMEEYRSYLKREHDQLVRDQISYLEKKQEEICENVSKTFDEYTHNLQSNFRELGQIGLKQAIEVSLKERNQLSQRLASIDLELECLDRMEADPKALISFDESSFSRTAQDIARSISELRSQRDLIDLSMPHNKQAPFSEDRYHCRKEELREIREKIESLRQLLSGEESQIAPLFDPDVSLKAWMARLTEAEGAERKDIAEYLENFVRLLSMQEKIVQEQIFYEREIPSEFKGLDHGTARLLIGEYNSKIDGCLARMGNLLRLTEEIGHPDFEISSLSAVLVDPLSKRLIGQASETALKLKDERHRSEKEGGRWADELALQKQILKEHLSQLYKVERLESDLFSEKISALQTLSVNCIMGQISALQARLSDMAKERKATLVFEKGIIQQKLEGLKGEFADFPERWRSEKWINLKTQMGLKMMHALTDLVESKTIASHLHHIESKPLDTATLPAIPRYPGIFLKAFLGAFLGGLGSFGRSFLRSLLKGFPSSKEKLAAMRYPLLGEITTACDGPLSEPLAGTDLGALRQISFLLDQTPRGKIVGIIEGKGPDYSHALAEHLGRLSFTSLLVHCDFKVKFSPCDRPGLLQIYKKEEETFPVRPMQGYDFLPSGGYTPYGPEIIRSHFFRELLEKWKERYDFILIAVRSPLDSAESVSPLSLCDKAIVTVAEEPTEQLTPFIDWAYHGGICRLAFLTLGSTT